MGDIKPLVIAVVVVFRKSEQSGEVTVWTNEDEPINEFEFFNLQELVEILDKLGAYQIAELEVRYV